MTNTYISKLIVFTIYMAILYKFKWGRHHHYYKSIIIIIITILYLDNILGSQNPLKMDDW